MVLTKIFLDEKIEEAEEKRNEEFADPDFVANAAEAREYKEITVEKIDGSFYLICGLNDVFILNDGGSYSRRLDSEEIANLPLQIIWNCKVCIIDIKL